MTVRWVTSAGIILLICASSQIAKAQEPEVATDGPSDEITAVATDEPIDEITVVGEKSVLKLKYEYELAEDNFYEMYNELNDDWEFDVICRNEAPTGSHIRRRICWPRYELELRTEEARSMLQRGAIDPAAGASAMAMSKRLKDKIAALAEEDPRLLEALVEYRDKYQAYESERKKNCRALIACGNSDED